MEGTLVNSEITLTQAPYLKFPILNNIITTHPQAKTKNEDDSQKYCFLFSKLFSLKQVGFLNVLSKSGSDPEHLKEYAQVARLVVEEGFDCEQVGHLTSFLYLILF